MNALPKALLVERQAREEEAIRAALVAAIEKSINAPNSTEQIDDLALSLAGRDIDQFHGRRAGVWLLNLSTRFIHQCRRDSQLIEKVGEGE